MLHKLVLGGLGGLTPLLAVILVADSVVIGQYLAGLFDTQTRQIAPLVGYITKALMLFVVGAFWAYLHKAENDLLKIYQLGIVAPAMILGSLSARELATQRGDQASAVPIAPSPSRHSLMPSFEFIPSAHAACPEGECSNAAGVCSKANCKPSSSWGDAFVAGFLSRPLAFSQRCASAPVTIALDRNRPMAMTEMIAERRCTFTVEGAVDGLVVRCPTIRGEVSVPKGFTVRAVEDKGACTLFVSR